MLKQLFIRPESPYWYAEVLVGGETIRFSTKVHRNPALRKRAAEAAERRLAELEAEHRAKGTVRLSAAAVAYLEDPKTKLAKSTADLYAKKLALVVAELADPPICDLTPLAVRALIKARKAKTSDIQIRAELTALSQVIEYTIGEDMDGAPEFNPVRLVSRKRLGKASAEARFLRPEEVQKLLAAARGPFWPAFIRLILETGMRHEEALGLKWSEVDQIEGVIDLEIQRDKKRRDRIVPLTPTSEHTLGGLVRDPLCEYVFVNPRTRTRYKSIAKGWIKLRTRAGVPKARIHDLRHTFASWTRRLGLSREDRMAIMGHTTVESHELYARGSVQTLREVLRAHSPHTLLTQERKL